jgi:hypothetical protein
MQTSAWTRAEVSKSTACEKGFRNYPSLLVALAGLVAQVVPPVPRVLRVLRVAAEAVTSG